LFSLIIERCHTLRSAHRSVSQQAFLDLEERRDARGTVSQYRRSIAQEPIGRCTVIVSSRTQSTIRLDEIVMSAFQHLGAKVAESCHTHHPELGSE
jgi:uncharacterized protein (DUF4415 family)